MYALLARLEKPLCRDTGAIIRQLYRLCSDCRAKLVENSPNFDSNLAELNMLISIAGSYFGQGEEYDSRQYVADATEEEEVRGAGGAGGVNLLALGGDDDGDNNDSDNDVDDNGGMFDDDGGEGGGEGRGEGQAYSGSESAAYERKGASAYSVVPASEQWLATSHAADGVLEDGEEADDAEDC